jgi:paired amphipathic helix protein Sin3a
VVELLKKNPTVAIPVILNRLEQKDAEWRKNREGMNVLWRKVFEQNYHKSLDHRSFYFKQADKKSLLPKAMMQEIKDAAEKRRADKNQLRALSLGCPMSAILQPDLAFDYMDR